MTTVTQHDPGAIVRDAEETATEVGSTLLHVTVIGMVASLFAAGVSGWVLSDHDPLTTGKLVLGAITIDLLLFRWLRIAGRLRKIGATTTAGSVLDVGAVLMTYYFAGLSGVCMLIPPGSDFAWGLMAVTYLFIPTVMLMSYIAMPGAQRLLREAADAATAEVERQRREVADRQAAEDRARQRQRDEVAKTANSRAAAEAGERAEKARIESEERVTIAELARGKSMTELQYIIAAIAVYGRLIAALENAQAIEAKTERRVRDRLRRQRVASASPVDTASASPARRQRVASRRRQQTSPAERAPGPASKLSVDELVALATATDDDLAVALAMGRDALRDRLATKAGGGWITDHKMKEVMARIQPGSNVTSLLGKAARGDR